MQMWQQQEGNGTPDITQTKAGGHKSGDILRVSGFRCEMHNCAVLGYYAASSGNFLPTFRDTYRSYFQGSKMDTLFSQSCERV